MKYLLFAILVMASLNLDAKIKLPALVSSHMVLQRDTVVSIWGWADKNETILLEASWLNHPLKVKSDKNGKWSIPVSTNQSLEAQTIVIKDFESEVVLNDILFGEVWLCSGQSNMNFSLLGNPGQPVVGNIDAIVHSKNDQLRLFTVNKNPSTEPLEQLSADNGSWQLANPSTVPNFSAVGYFFASQLQQILELPVGIIHTSWGASSVQAWMSADALAPLENINTENITEEPNKTQTALFNGMINPLVPYTIKGALWYQGESNRSEPDKYTQLLPAMVKDWRDRWDANFAFYYVQIAPFSKSNEYTKPKNAAFLREAQTKCIDLIPNSFMATTMDIGDKYSIHPPQKKEVADRLLYIALNKSYKYTFVDFSGPIYDSMEVTDEGIVLSFKYAENGLYGTQNVRTLSGFDIAGEDQVFYSAEAKIIDRRKVLVYSKKVPNPKAVRYGWQCYAEASLFDTSYLPAPSFRTDKWDDAIKKE